MYITLQQDLVNIVTWSAFNKVQPDILSLNNIFSIKPLIVHTILYYLYSFIRSDNIVLYYFQVLSTNRSTNTPSCLRQLLVNSCTSFRSLSDPPFNLFMTFKYLPTNLKRQGYTPWVIRLKLAVVTNETIYQKQLNTVVEMFTHG